MNSVCDKTIRLDKTWVLLWSFSQGCFHVETLNETVKAGIEAFTERHTFQDFIVLGVAEDRKEIDRLYDELLEKYGRPERTKTP